jgi:3'(2'), 5'-bisphosphate nucleotidase
MNNAASDLMHPVRALARRAGEEIMQIYASDFAIETKDDSSPVTAADQRAEAIILAGLGRIAPDIPAVAEEEVAAGRIPDVSDGLFWLIDPLDGTREFISRNGEFTVNIALIRAGAPILGCVHLPVLDETYWGGPDGAFRQRGQGDTEAIAVRKPPAAGLTVMVSRSHLSPETADYLEKFQIAERRDAGSSLKFCRLAEGDADLYPRLGRTMEWDIAAGHAVLSAAGGRVDIIDSGRPMTYGKNGFENPHFVARGG